TGAMYRAITLRAINEGVALDDDSALGPLAAQSKIEFTGDPSSGVQVFLNGTEVTEQIRSPEVTRGVSPVSAQRSVRRALVGEQRRMADDGGVVLDGRDIGSVVLPHADVKVYLEASLATRAKRRLAEMEAKGLSAAFETVKQDIERRDHLDSSRELSPLKAPLGAYKLDTTDLTIEEQVQKVVALARQKASEIAAITLRHEKTAPVEKIRPAYLLAQYLILLVLKCLWAVKIVKKSKHRFRENYIFACNHQSYSDPPLVGSTLPREVHFLAKQVLFKNRLFAWLIHTFNAIPIRRGGFDRRAMGITLDLLKSGRSVLIFPEGTRVRGGALGAPRSGVGYLALLSGVPVIPLYVRGSNRLAHCLIRRDRLIVAHGKPIRLTSPSGLPAPSNDDHREYSSMIMEAIQALKDEFG
ncbi:MAG: (d)CMP kinase, partial [Candidatus Latescibacterota bacterium]